MNDTVPAVYHDGSCPISDMPQGMVGYMVPWGMEVDADGHAFLNGQYWVKPDKGGTSTLKVERTERGYRVTLPPSGEYTWAFGRHSDWANLPVAEIVTL
jgi:hypothetical protein